MVGVWEGGWVGVRRVITQCVIMVGAWEGGGSKESDYTMCNQWWVIGKGDYTMCNQ